MNVVKRDNTAKQNFNKHKNEFVRKPANSLGIRGTSAFLPPKSSLGYGATKAPRYQFKNEEISIRSRGPSMGPPLEPPKSIKRKFIQTSTSSKPNESGSSSRRPRVLASDSAMGDTSDFCTPRNRPTALRYISSSSRGGHSGPRSARSTSASVAEPSVILAISEGRGMARGEIGIAAVDLRHPHLVLCQFSDSLLYTHTLTKINYFNPVEIIVPHTFCEGAQPTPLYSLVKQQFPHVTLTAVQRRHYNDANARQHIHTLCAPQYSSVYLQVVHKFYALTAAAAVLKYVEYIQCVVFVRESLKIEYHTSENTMTIDVGTATQLELVQPLVPSAGPTCCLLGVLGPTYTQGGIRALRAAILQPSCNKQFIEDRLDALQDLIDNDSGLMSGLQDILKKLSEVDKILLLCMEIPNQNMEKTGEAQLNQVLLLKTTMDLVPSLVEALDSADCGILRRMKLEFDHEHYKEIASRIKNIIQEDAHVEKGAMASLQRCFAVKPEINGLLDVARRTYSELIEDIQKMVEQLSIAHDIPLRLHQNMLKGFHIVLPIAPRNRRSFRVEDLPDIFIQVLNNGASVSMTTEELVVLDQQAKESLNEILKMSNIVISGLLKDLRPFMSSLYKLCENVAELDILLAMAHASTAGSYVRPQFGGYLDIRNSVHPLLDYNSQSLPVPNDIYASPEHNFTIITGPNMGGKSIYIKQIALMQIMAQLGCFLPATNAILRLSDRVFSRIGFNDSVELNASTFVLEMKEVQHILKSVTPTSLIIIDELCRGTSTEEGASIAWAVCEELLLKDAYTFFTTHFMYLTRLRDLYFNVVNLQTLVTEVAVQSQTQSRRLVYKHKIEPGVTNITKYGLALAANTNLPDITVQLAEELAELIEKSLKPQDISSPITNTERTLYALNAEVRKAIRKNDADGTVKQIIEKFKQTHPNIIDSIQTENQTGKSSEYKDSSNTLFSKDSIPKQIPTYSTLENNLDSSNNEVNFTSVRSSNELLNTIIRGDNNRNATNDEDIPMEDQEIPDTPNRTHEENIFKDFRKHEINNVDSDQETMEITSNGSQRSLDDDKDTTESLTQVISESEEISDLGQMSLDEDLMHETIAEIHEELNSDISSIVLAPPDEFRD